MRDLELNEDVLFKNFKRVSRTNFDMLLGMMEPVITILVSENQCLLK
jgi:hypothetical protein